MAELLATLLAALLGVVMDQLMAWHTAQRAQQAMLIQDRLTRQAAAQRINARIDREIGHETDIDVLLDRL